MNRHPSSAALCTRALALTVATAAALYLLFALVAEPLRAVRIRNGGSVAASLAVAGRPRSRCKTITEDGCVRANRSGVRTTATASQSSAGVSKP